MRWLFCGLHSPLRIAFSKISLKNNEGKTWSELMWFGLRGKIPFDLVWHRALSRNIKAIPKRTIRPTSISLRGHTHSNSSRKILAFVLQILPPIPPNCPREIYDLMCECWQRNESNRPNFREIHLFLQRKNLGYKPSMLSLYWAAWRGEVGREWGGNGDEEQDSRSKVKEWQSDNR